MAQPNLVAGGKLRRDGCKPRLEILEPQAFEVAVESVEQSLAGDEAGARNAEIKIAEEFSSRERKDEILQRKLQIESIHGPAVQVSDVYLRNGKIDSAFTISFRIQDLPNSEDLQTYMSQCATTWAGQLVNLHILAGEFQACQRVNSQGDNAWMGQVPVLGILKQDGDDGVFELEQFHFAE